MNHLRHQKYKNKQLNNTRVLKVKKSTLELENDFKPINKSINDIGKFEKHLVCWYDWLINYIPQPIKKPWVMLKNKL